jgi:DNA-binding ferritin-like protein
VEQLHERLDNMRNVNKGLSNAFEEARSVKPYQDSATVTELHATITTRDAKIEHVVDKYDKLTAEHFEVLKQVNEDADETQALRTKNTNQADKLDGFRARLTTAENHGDW